jgi:hypothetical protein
MLILGILFQLLYAAVDDAAALDWSRVLARRPAVYGAGEWRHING